MTRVRGWMGGGALGRTFLVAVTLAACTDEQPRYPPDAMLRDSVGLTEEDQVLRVELTTQEGGELVQPAELRVPPGAWVEFVVSDHRVHTVAFTPEGMTREQLDALRAKGQESSPPLLSLGTRFLVDLRDAPLGRYPFRVDGSGTSATGTIIIELPEGSR